MLAGVWLLEQPSFPPVSPFPPSLPVLGLPFPGFTGSPPFYLPVSSCCVPRAVDSAWRGLGCPEPGGTGLLGASLPPVLAHP